MPPNNEWRYWQDQWLKALENMPWKYERKDGWTSKIGQATALAMCLGYSWKTKYNNAGALISTQIDRGSKPRGKRAEALQVLAGPYGAIIAWNTLTKLGFRERFKYWPWMKS